MNFADLFLAFYHSCTPGLGKLAKSVADFGYNWALASQVLQSTPEVSGRLRSAVECHQRFVYLHSPQALLDRIEVLALSGVVVAAREIAAQPGNEFGLGHGFVSH